MSDAYGHVQFTEDTWRQLKEYTDLISTEVACMGYATLEGNVVKVNEVFLVPQVVSSGSVEFMDTGFPWAVNKALKEDRIDELRFIWHSHCNFGAFFSGTDEDMVRKVRDHGPIPWLANVVLNKKGETHAQIDYFQLGDGVGEFCNHLTLGLDVQVGEIPADATEQRLQELEEMCTPKYKSYTSKGSSSSGGEKKGKSGCTARDWRLHNEARTKEWESFVDPEHYIHYWDPKDGGKYKGSAPVPRHEDGSFHSGYDTTVADSSVIEALDNLYNEGTGVDFDKMSDEEIDEYVDRMIEFSEQEEDELDEHVTAVMKRDGMA